MPRLLLIDPNPIPLLDQIGQALSPATVPIDVATTPQQALKRFQSNPPDAVLLDLDMPDLSGLGIFHKFRQADARIPVIFITASSTISAAIDAMRHGAFDYVLKPVDLQQLQTLVTAAMEQSRRMRRPAYFGAPSAPEDGDPIIGCCPPMLEVCKTIGRIAHAETPVLITGEAGTGKDLVARAIYQHSPRAKSLFLTVNCAAVDPTLVETELFGHKAGAPAADRPRRLIGKFEQCNRGTLFLDEIADIPLAIQAKILRLLADQQFHRIGGIQSIHPDVRVIASSSRDLKALVSGGKFNQELYHRLSTSVISLPPLRQRGDDLDLLTQFYLERLNSELGREVAAISPQAMERLHRHDWPGNVRELQSVIEQSLLGAKGTMLTPESLPEFETESSPAVTAAGEFDFDAYIRERLKAGSNDLHTEVHLQLDRILLPAALRFVNGNQLHAAKILGIARQTLRNRLRELGLTIHKAVTTDGQAGQGNRDRVSMRTGEEAASSQKGRISSYH